MRKRLRICSLTMATAKKRVSIKDLARQAGVSAPTVSRALRGHGRVSDATRRRILQLAQELGYTPSLLARGLVTQRSFCVGLVVTTFADPFHSEVAQGVEEEARQHHYSLFLASTGVDPARELEVVRTFQGRQVDGIIVSASRAGNRHAELLQETGIPLVLVNTHVAGDNIYSIAHDDYAGGTLLLHHLLERGRRRIAYVGNERGVQTDVERRRAWRETLAAAGIEATVTASGPNGRLQGGVIAGERVLEAAFAVWGSPPDAIYCYNDTMAIGVMSVLRNHELRVPQDVAVTGFDDIDVAGFLAPPLTTVRQPRRQMGAEAMKVLLALINGEMDPAHPQRKIMQGELIVRAST
jgi:DNA-binding LacI/PurR family transcriptional regulator